MANAKTLRKRIALVAATALGVGVLVAAPASATTSLGTLSAVAATVNTPLGGATTVGTGSFTAQFTGTGSDTVTVTASVSSQVAGSTATVAVTTGALTGTGTPSQSATGAVLTFSTTAAGTAIVTGAPVALTVNLPGKYVVTLTPSAAGIAAGMAATTITYNFQALYAISGDGLTAGNASNSTVNGVAGPANIVTLGASQQGTATRLVAVSGAGATILSGGTVAANGLSSVIASGTAGTVTNVVVATPAAGTITASIYDVSTTPGIYNTTATSVVTITVNPGFAASTYNHSTAFINTAIGAQATVNTPVASLTSSGTVSNTAAARISVTQYASADSSLPVANGSGTAVSVTVAGAGTVDTLASNGLTRGVAASAGAGGNALSEYVLFPDGRTGTSTITVSVNGAVVSTFTYLFTGALASYTTATVAKSAIGIGETDVWTYTGLDANKNPATSLGTVYTSSSNTAVATVANIGGVVTVTGVAPGTANITIANAATSPTISKVVAVTVTKITAKTVSVAFDKATYAPGDKITITVSAVDANGAPVADGTRALFSATGLTSNVSLVGMPTPSANVALVGGKATYTVYAPLAAGPIKLSATEGASTDNVIAAGTPATITASATVAADTSATDAATAAAKAAQAAVAALSVTVASLIASVTAQLRALTIIVKKIQAKLKIK